MKFKIQEANKNKSLFSSRLFFVSRSFSYFISETHNKKFRKKTKLRLKDTQKQSVFMFISLSYIVVHLSLTKKIFLRENKIHPKEHEEKNNFF